MILIQNGNSINLRYTSNYLAEIVDYAVDQNLVAFLEIGLMSLVSQSL